MIKRIGLLLLVLGMIGGGNAVGGDQVDAQAATGTQAGPKTEMSAYESKLIGIEEEKLALERRKAWINGFALAIPLLAAVLAYWSTQRLQGVQASDNFQLKAAEIAMTARNSYDAKGRAVALAALFPEKLPKDLGEQFDPEKYSWGRESRRELLSLIAAHPEHRAVMVRAWKSLFPHDEWINDLPVDL